MSKRKEFSNNESYYNAIFSKDIPVFKSEYEAVRQEKKHKQFGFVCTFVYDKRMNMFIFESRGSSTSQYKRKVSPIGGKREQYFQISRNTMKELNKEKSSKRIKLEIISEEIDKVLNSHDGFENNVIIELENWNLLSDDNSSDELFVCESTYEMVYTQEDIFYTMSREVYEEIGLDVKKTSCDIKYFGYDKNIFETDKIITHVFLVTFDSYDFIPYSKEKKKGNMVIAMNQNEIMEKIHEDKDETEVEKYFTPTIYNVFEEVTRFCKPYKQEIILFGGPYVGLTEGVRRCIKFFSSIGLEVSSTLSLPKSYHERKCLKTKEPSIRDLYSEYFKVEENIETRQFKVLLAYNAIRKLLHGKTEPDVGNKPITIFERSPRCVNIYNKAYDIPEFLLDDLLEPYDPDRLDVHITPQDKDKAFEYACKRRTYTSCEQIAYQKTYEIYEKSSSKEYPNQVLVKNDMSKVSTDFFTDELVNAIEKHASLGKLVRHAKKYKLNLTRATAQINDTIDSTNI